MIWQSKISILDLFAETENCLNNDEIEQMFKDWLNEGNIVYNEETGLYSLDDERLF